jgi:drug/metabolite transporter (DMT)-like permease
MTTTATQRRNAYFAWAAVCIIWGTTYLAIKISLETVPPFIVGGLRFTCAGLVLAAIRLAQGKQIPSARALLDAAIVGALLLGFGNGGVVYAEQFVPSGLAAVLVAAVAFWMVGVEALVPGGERLTRRSLIGLLIGFAGIVLLVWPDLFVNGAAGSSPGSGAGSDSGSGAGSHPGSHPAVADHVGGPGWGFALGVIALQMACFGWALGSSYARRHRTAQDDLITTSAFQMFFGGAVMLIVATLTGEWSHVAFTARTGSALFYLFAVGSLVGFVAYIYALGHLSTSFVSLYAYVNPVVAVILGSLILGEPFGWRLIGSIAIILAGMTVVTRKKPFIPSSAPRTDEGQTRARSRTLVSS